MLDVPGDLVLEPGEALGVVDEGLGAGGVELVDVDVEADRGDVAVEPEGAQRRDVDLRPARERRAQGHRRVHGPDRSPDVADHQQPQPGAEQDDGDEAGGADPGAGAGGEFRGRGHPAVAAAADENAGDGADGVHHLGQDVQDCGGDAGHWSRMPRARGGYAGRTPRSYPTMGACWR